MSEASVHEPTHRGPSDSISAVRHTLQEVYDPCCRDRELSVVDMGLIDTIDIDGATARVTILLTSALCPFSGQLLPALREAVLTVPGIDEAVVTVTHARAWTPERLSERARRTLLRLPSPTLDHSPPAPASHDDL